ncbi:MAG TPA: hypothetical protein VD789_07550 [Thermomicrobiales bacterium]|nr:hypothetical protein [Thermomicrobiales bacterium]
MKHALFKGILVLVVAVLAMFGTVAVSVGAYEASDAPAAFARVQATETIEATAEGEATGVTNLPETGRGTGKADDAGAMALHQMLMTILVLSAAAVLALGGIALAWRYERR